MKIGIGAIFRDEFEYILEWIAWHKIAGFDKFIIADNHSLDGTTELLEALEEIELINLIYQPVLEKNSQIIAYQRITQRALTELDALLFIDADEFITHESMIDGEEARFLTEKIKAPNIGMIGINWRVFGSSGLEKFEETPVIERFTHCCNDDDFSKNCYLKSITKIALAKYIGPHKSDLFAPFKRIDIIGNELSDFIEFKDGIVKNSENSGTTRTVAKGAIRINHYAIKSKEEFLNKKNKRGDAMHGPSLERGMSYFNAHNFRDESFSFPEEKIERLKSLISSIDQSLRNKSTLYVNFRGAVDSADRYGVSGWLLPDPPPNIKPKINIFVNGTYQGSAKIGFYRPDLKQKGLSTDGMNGFRWTPPTPLNPGDTIEVKVNANRFKFPKRSKSIID